MSKKIGGKEYETELAKLQIELNRITHWVHKNGRRVVVLVEGRDTAGKGGVIAAIKAHMNSRSCRTVALGKPTDVEASQWYFQRYLAHLPAAGEFVFFDRSWYNRAGVEKVMGFCTPQQTKDFLKQVPILEKMLVDDGILLFKYWLTVDQDEQENASVSALMTHSNSGSCHRSMCYHVPSTTITLPHVKPCWKQRTPSMHRGRWSISTVRSSDV
jgi:polyphosphate kinase 2 (PPK2 family)